MNANREQPPTTVQTALAMREKIVTGCRYYQGVEPGGMKCRAMIEKKRGCCETCEQKPEAGGSEEVSVKDLKCNKCGRVFKHQKRLTTHEAACAGPQKGRGTRQEKKTVAPAARPVTPEAVLNVFSIRPEVTVGQLIQAYPKARIEAIIVKALIEAPR